MNDQDTVLMKVKGTTEVGRLAAAIYQNLKSGKSVHLRTLGAGPTQQACKAAAVVRGNFATEGKRLLLEPCLHDIEPEPGNKLTALTMICRLQSM